MLKNSLRVCLVSLDQKFEDKEANRNRIISILEKMSEYKCDLFVFPEMTLTGYTLNIEHAEVFEKSESLKFFVDISSNFQAAVVFGISLIEKNSYINRAYFIDDTGKALLQYDKIHPFSYAGENEIFKAGDYLDHINYRGFNVGLTICYDLRFPEIYSVLSRKSDIIINIANWPASRIQHWRVLLQARAIENQVFMIGVNRTGEDPKNIYEKSSMLIYPSGEIAKPILYTNELDIYEINKNDLIEYRKTFSTYKDKRWELYHELYYKAYYDSKG